MIDYSANFKLIINRLVMNKLVIGILLFCEKEYFDNGNINKLFVFCKNDKININSLINEYLINTPQLLVYYYNYYDVFDDIDTKNMWFFLNSKLVFQRGKKLSKLLNKYNLEMNQNLIDIIFVKMLDIKRFIIFSKKWELRNDHASSIHMINHSIMICYELVFLLNLRVIPPIEYYQYIKGNLNFFPKELESLLKNIDICNASKQKLEESINLINEICNKIKAYLYCKWNYSKYIQPLNFFNINWLYLFIYIYIRKKVEINYIINFQYYEYLSAYPMKLIIKYNKLKNTQYVEIDSNKVENLISNNNSELTENVYNELCIIWNKLKYKDVIHDITELFNNKKLHEIIYY